MERLYTALSFGGILTHEQIEYILTFCEAQDLKVQEEFLSLGTIGDKLGFVNEGILRVYSLGSGGEEVTKYFFRQNQFAVDLESYYNLTPCEIAIQAVVDSNVLYIKRSNWDKLSEEIPKLYILTKSLSEATLLNKIKDNDFLNYGTAQVKYQEFTRRYPDLALHVPQQMIASYLKITPQSLSRIRKNLTNESSDK